MGAGRDQHPEDVCLASCQDIEQLHHLIGFEVVYVDRSAAGRPHGAAVAGAYSKQGLSGLMGRLLTPREVAYGTLL